MHIFRVFLSEQWELDRLVTYHATYEGAMERVAKYFEAVPSPDASFPHNLYENGKAVELTWCSWMLDSYTDIVVERIEVEE